MIFKQKGRRKAYTTLSNRALRDERLSFKATGLLAFLLSMPETWEPNSKHLAGMKTDGRDSVRAGLRELETAGYLVRTRIRLSSGAFDWEIGVYENPVTMDGKSGHGPGTGSPSTGEPSTVNPASKESLRLLTDESVAEAAEDWLSEPAAFTAPMPDELKARRKKKSA